MTYQKIKSKLNGNSILLPAPGWYNGTVLTVAGQEGAYWMRSLDIITNSSQAYVLYWDRNYAVMDISVGPRNIGQCIRPVRKKN